jgi:tRNA 2-selenouridine synthase
MALELTDLTQLLDHGFDDIVDVRSPSEYAEDRLPGAISLPVLDDDERARVGTIYTRVDKFQARKMGAALVSRNAAAHLEGPLADRTGAWRPLVYCWRGGQRSGSFASILEQIGWRVELLEGGYRSYRRLVAAALYDRPLPHRVILIDGNTGTAKTEILHLLAGRGHQVLDLEGLGNHRGSVFGAMAGEQPAQKAFESAIAMRLAAMDAGRPVLVEAESNKVGACLVPPSLWTAMRVAPRLEVTAPPQARARYLRRAYSDITAAPERLAARLDQLRPLQGHETVDAWQAMAAIGDFETLALELITRHYDPRYARARERHDPTRIRSLPLDSLTPEALAAALPIIETEIERL